MTSRPRPLPRENRFRRSLSAFVQKMAATPDILELLRNAFDIIRGIVRVDAMFVAVLTGQSRYLKLLETDLDDEGNRVFCAPQPIEANDSSVLETLNQRRYVLVHRTKEELRRFGAGFKEGENWNPIGNPARRSASLLFVPIWHGATYAGALSVQSYERNAYSAGDAERLVVVADYIGLAIRHSRLVRGSRSRRHRGIV